MNGQEKSLMLQLICLEATCFEDFTFAPRSLASKYFRNGDLGYNLGLSDISISISKKHEINAFDAAKKTLHFLPDDIHKKHILLHEMIHVFEYLFCNTIPALREILTLQIYKKLSAKHLDLDAYLDQKLNRKEFLEIIDIGGPHGTLFALKALDIDDRMGWEPGTTFGYSHSKSFD